MNPIREHAFLFLSNSGSPSRFLACFPIQASYLEGYGTVLYNVAMFCVCFFGMGGSVGYYDVKMGGPGEW